MRRTVTHVCAVMKGILFTGFTVQIILGLCWMCCNFLHVQEFGEADSALYRMLSGMFGGKLFLPYALQLAAAYTTGHLFMNLFAPARGIFAVWRDLALLTCPFAMQCHLAALPHSFMNSLFLLTLTFLAAVFLKEKGSGGKRIPICIGAAFLCAAVMLLLSGAADEARRGEAPEHRFAASMASRFGWSHIWQDVELWPEELRAVAGERAWEVSFAPGNMFLLESAFEESAGAEAAEEYYRQIAATGWQYHSGTVIRQIGWDILGYTAAPAIFPLQMKGRAYDSYTLRNYEVMRGNSPVLTKYYVYYGCRWFICCMGLAPVLSLLQGVKKGNAKRRGLVPAVGICILASGLLTVLFTMRGAGFMDYKLTAAVFGLWTVWALTRLSAGGPADTQRR